MGQDFRLPATLQCDAKTAEVFAMGTAQRSRIKNIDQRQQWCADLSSVELSSSLTFPGGIGCRLKFFFRLDNFIIKRRGATWNI